MLKMISSSAFIENGNPRPPIVFHKGLNSIIGIENNSNSIGKSTLLMIIDFCFGGDDYTSKELDTLSNVGHHTIEFEYEFNDTRYRFERNTENPQNIRKFFLDGKTAIISLVDFREWLAEKYEIKKLNMTFRQTISRFFRIYNRGTYNELRPLNATVREDDKTGIISMLKLFNIISDLDVILKKLEELKETEITYKNLKKLNVGNIAANQKDYEINIQKIYELETELADLKKDNNLGAIDIEIVELEEKNQLTIERKRLRTEKRNLEIQKERIKLDKELDPISLAKNIDKLKSFFPNTIFNELEKVEKFHKDIKNILNTDVKENNKNIDNLIFFIDEQINKLNNELDKVKNTPSIPDIVLKRYSYLEGEIKRLREENINFDNQKNNKAEFKNAEEDVKNITGKKTAELTEKINSKLDLLNKLYFVNTNSPILAINGLSSYQFFIPNDTGTGSRYRAVITFDMVVLQNTPLPAIAHDSVMITNIDEDKRNKIFTLYSDEKEKQIFIAFDYLNIADHNTRQLVLDSAVIKLSNGGRALFGRQWNSQK